MTDFPCCEPGGSGHPPLSSLEAVVSTDDALLESRFQIARLMANGPLTDEPGA